MIIQAVYFKTCILKCFDGELGTIFRIYVLRVTLDHNVVDFAVSVFVDSVQTQIRDDLALEGTGLSSVTAYIGNVPAVLVPSCFLVFARLTVDVYQRNACAYDFICDGLSGRGIYGVDDQNVNALSDESVDLVGLGSLVILAILNGDVIFAESKFYQVIFQLCTNRVMKLSEN